MELGRIFCLEGNRALESGGMDLQWTGEIGSAETQLPLLVTHVSCLFPSHHHVSQRESLATLSFSFQAQPRHCPCRHSHDDV